MLTQAATAQDGNGAAPGADAPAVSASPSTGMMGVREMLEAGGYIGYIILALSVGMVALIVEHLITIRRGALIPDGLAEQVHQLLAQGQVQQAQQACSERPSFLSRLLSAGLDEVGVGYNEIEKAMESSAAEQAARLFRKVEYLSVIATIAPMLGLLGTVWGMILAFMEFEQKANPQVSELAPGIYRALVTTLFGLCVAVPALASLAFFRNRIDELVAQASLLAEHVFADLKRLTAARRKAERRAKSGRPVGRPATPLPPQPPVPRETTR